MKIHKGLDEMKKLSIIKNTFGVEKIPVIILNFHDEQEKVNFYPSEGVVDVELIDRIGCAIKNGYVLSYNENPTIGDLK